MKKAWILLAALLLMACGIACGAADSPAKVEAVPAANGRRTEADVDQSELGNMRSGDSETAGSEERGLETAMKMNVQIGDKLFAATLEDNAAVRELIEMMRQAPVTIHMSDYSGFEKVGALGRSLPTDNRQTTTAAGDIVLYNGDQIVLFYGPNSWSYTRIGHIDDLTGWADALGEGDIAAVFSIAE